MLCPHNYKFITYNCNLICSLCVPREKGNIMELCVCVCVFATCSLLICNVSWLTDKLVCVLCMYVRVCVVVCMCMCMCMCMCVCACACVYVHFYVHVYV